MTCSKCTIYRSVDEFGESRGPDGKVRTHTVCNPCRSADALRWYHANIERNKNNYLKRRYGITLETYNEIIKKQNGRCSICGDPPGDRRARNGTLNERVFDVDHCHKTAKVRGLLCNNCNQGLGQFKDSPRILSNALNYLLCFQISQEDGNENHLGRMHGDYLDDDFNDLTWKRNR